MRVGYTVKFMFALWKERGESLCAVKDILIMKVLIALHMNYFLSRKHTKLGDCMNDVDE